MFGYAGPFQFTAAIVIVLIGSPESFGPGVAVAAAPPPPPEPLAPLELLPLSSPPPHAASTSALAAIAARTVQSRSPRRWRARPTEPVGMVPSPLSPVAGPTPAPGTQPLRADR